MQMRSRTDTSRTPPSTYRWSILRMLPIIFISFFFWSLLREERAVQQCEERAPCPVCTETTQAIETIETRANPFATRPRLPTLNASNENELLFELVRRKLTNRWVFLLGDSTLRIMLAALVNVVNGTLQDYAAFGSYVYHGKGTCTEAKLGRPACLREYVDLQLPTRISFSFKSYVNDTPDAFTNLVSAAQQPDVLVVATGAWDYYNEKDVVFARHFDQLRLNRLNKLAGTRNETSETVRYAIGTELELVNKLRSTPIDLDGATVGNATLAYIETLRARFPRPMLVVANLVRCSAEYSHYTETYNKYLDEHMPADERLVLLDRGRLSANLTESAGDQRPTYVGNCSGFHVYKDAVLEQLKEFLNGLPDSI